MSSPETRASSSAPRWLWIAVVVVVLGLLVVSLLVYLASETLVAGST